MTQIDAPMAPAAPQAAPSPEAAIKWDQPAPIMPPRSQGMDSASIKWDQPAPLEDRPDLDHPRPNKS